MKIDRLMGILTILLRQEKTTAPALARRFEVSRRTINRDLEDLCRAGIPVVSMQGYGGGVCLAPGYKLDKTLLTRRELQTVLAGVKGMESVSAAPYTAGLLEKLAPGAACVAAADEILIDLAEHDRPGLTQKIETVRAAIQARRVLVFHYYYEKGEARRKIEPYHLIFRWSAWYVLGYCLDRQAYRLFKLNRLWEPECPGDTFTPRAVPPEALDARRYFRAAAYHLQAEFDPGEKYRLVEEYGADCYTVSPQGRLRFAWDFSSYAAMREWVFSFGDKVRVLAPAQLREDHRAQAENILRQRPET